MPRWGWGPRRAASHRPRRRPEPQAAAEPELPGPDEPVSFAAHIRPLFRDGTGSR